MFQIRIRLLAASSALGFSSLEPGCSHALYQQASCSYPLAHEPADATRSAHSARPLHSSTITLHLPLALQVRNFNKLVVPEVHS